MRIYIVGAHSCGKTTLCRYISDKYNLDMMPEMARTVLARMEVPIETLRADLNLLNRFQRSVVSEQIIVEKLKEKDFVSDRAFDAWAYAAEHSTVFSELIADPEFKNYIDWVREGIVFFIRPNKNLLKEDGVRETPTWDSVLRIDGMIKLMLELYNVDYLSISSPSMQERVRTVDFVLKRLLETTNATTST